MGRRCIITIMSPGGVAGMVICKISAYVLQDFSDAEVEILSFVLDKAVQAILTFITEGIEQTMTEHN